jgi:hypothetical protein
MDARYDHLTVRRMRAAIEAVLMEVERPVGSLHCRLPDTRASSDTLLGLYYAIGRYPTEVIKP